MSFKERLRDEIEYSGLLYKEIADKAGIEKRAFDMYVGKRSSIPPADVAVKIAKVLGVSVEYLVNGEDPKQELSLSPNTRKLVNIFQQLDTNDQEALLNLAETLIRRYANDGETDKSPSRVG